MTKTERIPSHYFVAALLLLLAGCGSQTQIAPANRKLLEGLQTAVSSKNTEWLEAVVKQLDDRRTKGEISSAEFQSIGAVIQLAKADDWDTALKRVFALSEAQRPTAEDQEQRQNVFHSPSSLAPAPAGRAPGSGGAQRNPPAPRVIPPGRAAHGLPPVTRPRHRRPARPSLRAAAPSGVRSP